MRLGSETSVEGGWPIWLKAALLIGILATGGFGIYTLISYCDQPNAYCLGGRPPAQVSFDSAVVNRTQYSGTTTYNFTGGLVLYFNASKDNHGNLFRLAIAVPVDYANQNLTSLNADQTLAIASPENLTVGQEVDAIGNLDVATNSTTNTSIYFIRAQSVKIYGTLSNQDPNYTAFFLLVLWYQNQQNTANDNQIQQSNDFLLWYVVFYFCIYNNNVYGSYAYTGSYYDDGDGSSVDDSGGDSGDSGDSGDGGDGGDGGDAGAGGDGGD
jgi:hypothetical protein